jgi:rod shape determining protein RodA
MSRESSVAKIFRGGGTFNKGAEESASRKIFHFKNIKKVNKLILLVFSFILLIGLVNLMAVSNSHAAKQSLYVIFFSPIFFLIISVNPRYFIKFAYVAFLGSLLMLVSIFVIGDISMGARRWIDLKIFKFQPSEIAKIVTVIAIARYYHFLRESEIYKLKSALVPFSIIFLQVGLILKQPDLGTSMTVILIGLSVIFLSGLKIRYFVLAFLGGLLLIPILWGKLHDYQKQRVKTFLNPDEDSLGTGYNIIQAKIAIGSGGFFGKGIFAGTQGTLDFIPESHTDFAFTVFAEQFGFLGFLILLSLYSVIIIWGTRIALEAESHFIRLMSAGITCIFFLHIVINLAMTSGMIPVVGNPLPLISYGGTFLISNLICFAILLNMEINKAIVIHSSKDSYMEK